MRAMTSIIVASKGSKMLIKSCEREEVISQLGSLN